MASSAGPRQKIEDERSAVSMTTGDPMRTFRRTVQQMNTSLYANIPVMGVQQLGINNGDAVAIDVYRDRVVIHTDTGDE